jgi:hypothetical protein
LYETALKKINSHAAIWSIDLQETGTFEISDTVYPQAINRDCCDKKNQSGARKHWVTQIIFQPGGVNPKF